MQIYNFRHQEWLQKLDGKITRREVDEEEMPFAWDEYYFLRIAYYLKLATNSLFIGILVERVIIMLENLETSSFAIFFFGFL